MNIFIQNAEAITIELLMGRVTNDVLYIHRGQHAIAHGGELTD